MAIKNESNENKNKPRRKDLKGKPTMGVSEKSRIPMKNKETVNKNVVEKNKVARAANVQTLYIRFSENFPNSLDEIKEMHSEITNVRAPMMAAKEAGKSQTIKYAFIEFENEEICQKAKNKLTTTQFKGKELYVDFVGEKGKKGGSKEKEAQINPTRLFVSGLTPGVTKDNLKDMFPKSSGAEIPKGRKDKGTTYGFVQFSNPEDAKSTFDNAKDLSISGHPIIVLYAKKTAAEDEKDAKRKAKKEKKKAEKVKLAVEPNKDVKSTKEAVEEDSKKTIVKDAAALKKGAKRKERKKEKDARRKERKTKAKLASEPKKDDKSEEEAMDEDDEKEVDTDKAV